MKEKILKLVNVKRIVTIILTFVVSWKVLKNELNIEQIYLMIIAFYFGTQHEKSNSEKNE